MSNAFSVYRNSDGVVLRTGTASDPDHIAMQAQSGETVEANPPADLIADGLWQWTASGYVHNAAPAPTLDQLKATALADLAALEQIKLSVWLAGNIQTDDTSRINLNGAVSLAQIAAASGTAYSQQWIMADNTVRTFTTPTQFITFAASVGEYYSKVIFKNAALKAAIRSAADATALAAIDLITGWPT
jgi:hypothetical protein